MKTFRLEFDLSDVWTTGMLTYLCKLCYFCLDWNYKWTLCPIVLCHAVISQQLYHLSPFCLFYNLIQLYYFIIKHTIFVLHTFIFWQQFEYLYSFVVRDLVILLSLSFTSKSAVFITNRIEKVVLSWLLLWCM